MLQRKLSTVLLAKYAYITGGSKHPAKTMSLASNEHIDNQCCNILARSSIYVVWIPSSTDEILAQKCTNLKRITKYCTMAGNRKYIVSNHVILS